MEKVLCIDSDPIGEELLHVIRFVLNDSTIKLTHTETVDLLNEYLTSSLPNKFVIINFQMDYFREMRHKTFENFISTIRASAQGSLVIVGVTGDRLQNEWLKKLGIHVIHKVYDRAQIKEIFGKNGTGKSILTTEKITRIVCKHLNAPYDLVLGKRRKRELVTARQISMFLSKEFTSNSLKTIGNHFNGRDHTTVVHSRTTVKDLMDTDEQYAGIVYTLREKLFSAQSAIM